MASSSSASASAVFHIAIYDTTMDPPHKLAAVSELSSFGRFTRGSIEEFMNFAGSTVAKRTAVGSRQSVQERSYMVHAYTRSEGCTGIIITNAEYPPRIPHELLNRMLDEFITANPRSRWAGISDAVVSPPKLEEYLSKYQDPAQADNITKIQRELDETKIVLHKTIESVLDRGEKLDTLVQRSDNLSAASKMFYTNAKKQNSCCVVM
ncbi:synaptobrevin-like YKT6 [Drechslerella stenobrocha 248]|uniref:Synaptobrevin homolog YKT6 n=1 Tax=Drechslerella stenobrocha 248 TaxID=1043628 RepID=W7HW78_9PEZI|nr:synaptobrevin-like YKT6 [Drechslerella stenobrocha 248]